MTWTRRNWMLSALAAPFAAAPRWLAQQSPRTAPQQGPLPITFGPPPTLPDKANFSSLRGTYLNSSSTHPRPDGAMDLIRRSAAAETGDAAGFRPNQRRIIGNFAKLINADADEIVFVPSTQAGEAFVAAAVGVPERGAHVVSDYLHFCGSMEMYTDMQRQRGVEVTWVKMNAENKISPDDLDRAIVRGKTKLVAISSASFVSGFQHDVKRVCEIAHAKGAMVYVDAIQQCGNAPVDVKDSGVDALCSGTYKYLMSSGTAFLYIRRESQARMLPPFYHWSQYNVMVPETHMYPFDTPGPVIVDHYAPKPGAAGLFAMGYEPNQATLAGLEYSLPYIMNIGVDNISAHAQPLIARLKAELPKRGYPLLTPVDSTSPIVTVVAQNAAHLADTFRAANVNVTTRWNTIRISVSVYNDMADVDRLLEVIPRAV